MSPFHSGGQILYYIGSSVNVNSILQARLNAGGKDTEEGMQKVFFAPLDPFGNDTHHQSTWKVSQDAVCRINLGKAQEKGLQVWQTRSHASIFYDSVPADCTKKWYAFKEAKFCIKGFPRLVQLPR